MATIKSGDIPAITQEILAKLATKGYQRVTDFISTPPERITTVSGLPHKKVIAIRRLLLAQFSSFPVNGGDLYDISLDTTSMLPTSCPQLDHLLTGGFYTGETTEICGSSCTGKTQLCMTWALNIAKEFEQNVIYIDSTGSCSPRRFADMIRSSTHNGVTSFSNILSKIRILKCCSLLQLKSVMREIEDVIKSQEDPFICGLKAIVIDSMTSLLMPLFFTDTYMEGTASVQEMGCLLNTFAREYSLAIVIVNDMVSSRSPEGDFRKAALGLTWGHVASVRLMMTSSAPRDHHNDVTLAQLVRSPRHHLNTAATRLRISAGGTIDDVTTCQ